jgi:transcriptional regulator with XRE-family HTH domain
MNDAKNIFTARLAGLKDATPLRRFGARIGVTEGTVRNYLLGRTKPKMDVLEKISKEYNVSIEWLLGIETPSQDGISELCQGYEGKMPPEDVKIAEIRAYINEISHDSTRVKRFFVKQFLKCFEEDFLPWSKTKGHAITIKNDDILKNMEGKR